jgi:hypothetical protein
VVSVLPLTVARSIRVSCLYAGLIAESPAVGVVPKAQLSGAVIHRVLWMD